MHKNMDLFSILVKNIHNSLPDNDEPIISSALYFASLFTAEPLDDSYSSLLCNDLARKKKSYRLELQDHLKSVAESALESMVKEIEECRTGYYKSHQANHLPVAIADQSIHFERN
ncbi:hypothetical protein [Paenibacillus monticola]|uniref:Uncharacterized protein n=1 Tax=Paenibacillus monticola TaxID=2666075 RepID=A0A7X2L246_9BACL|nr:hypothetical protein [Paenibacillus monticola]MRN53830.1 hypothetical protein [Paenibacillus monticola]